MPALNKICPACRKQFGDGERLCPDDQSLLAPIPVDELVGTTIDDKLEIQQRISSGGWGCVYQARHRMLNQTVAVKVLHQEYATDLDKVARFQREAQAISRLKNPHVVNVHDYGMLPNGRPYLVMEYINGASLSDVTSQKKDLRIPVLLDIFMQACDALSEAHKKGIVHRDIKPGNIMFFDSGNGTQVAKILDFGLAQLTSPERSLTKSGETLGSPSYMSPEQCRGLRLDGRSDIYSLGCVLFEVLTGERPFDGNSTVDLMSKHLFSPPKQFARTRFGKYLPRVFEHIVSRCLAKDPAARYQTMEELSGALGDALLVWMGADMSAVPETPRDRVGKFVGKACAETGKACLFVVELARVLRGQIASH